MALADDLQRGWRTAVPMASIIGQNVQVRQIHISLFPAPALHLGVALGTVQADGTFQSSEVRTVVLHADDIAALNPAQAVARAELLRTLVDTAYTMLRESQAIAAGARV